MTDYTRFNVLNSAGLRLSLAVGYNKTYLVEKMNHLGVNTEKATRLQWS